MATPAMARFLSNFLRSDLRELDQLLEADRERRQRRHDAGIPFVDTEVTVKNKSGMVKSWKRERRKIFLPRHQLKNSWRHRGLSQMRISQLDKTTLNFTLWKQEKTTKDFIQTRSPSFKMRCQNHWNQNQKSRLKFQSHSPAKIQ